MKPPEIYFLGGPHDPLHPLWTPLYLFIKETNKEMEDLVTNTVTETLFDRTGNETTTVVRRLIANNEDNIPSIINNIEDSL